MYVRVALSELAIHSNVADCSCMKNVAREKKQAGAIAALTPAVATGAHYGYSWNSSMRSLLASTVAITRWHTAGNRHYPTVCA
jgi:hypothetical protein